MDSVQPVRTNLSCDQCFRSKVKCCRTKPQCSRCKRLNFTCTNSPGLPRGKPKAKNYCSFQLPSIEPSEAVNCDVPNRVESPQTLDLGNHENANLSEPLEPNLLNLSSNSLMPDMSSLTDYTSVALHCSSFETQVQNSLTRDGFDIQNALGDLYCPTSSSAHSEHPEGSHSSEHVDFCFCIENQIACLHRMYGVNMQRADVSVDQVLTLARQAITSIEESLGCQGCQEKNTMWIYLLLLHSVGSCFERAFNTSVSDLQTRPVYFGNFQIDTTGRESEILAMAVDRELQRSIDVMDILDDQWGRLHQSQLSHSRIPECVAHLSSDFKKYFGLCKHRLRHGALSQ